MNRKSHFVINSLSTRKRLLMVANTRVDADQRSDFLRRNGFEVDCATGTDVALTMSRTHSYDVVVLALDSDCHVIANLAEQIQKANPNAMVACLADCKKPVPPLPCDRMLWKGEPLEYFLARVETLAATA
jgi:CheY-like chemotaxis protein